MFTITEVAGIHCAPASSVKAGSTPQARLVRLWPDIAVFCALVVERAISLVRSHVMSLINIHIADKPYILIETW